MRSSPKKTTTESSPSSDLSSPINRPQEAHEHSSEVRPELMADQQLSNRSTRGLSRGVWFMLGASLCFAIMSLLVKLVGDRLPSPQIVLVRSVISLVLSYGLLRHARVGIWGHNRPLLLLRGVFGFGGLYCFYYALTELPFAEATVIFYTSPVLTALLAGAVLGEAITFRLLASLAVSLLGVTLIAQPSFLFNVASPLDTVAVIVALAGAICSAAAYVTVRHLRKTDHSLVIVFYFPLVTVPLTIPLAWNGWLWPTPVEWLILAGIGASTQMAQVLLTRGLALEAAGRATAVGYVQVVFAVIFGLVFFNEIPGDWTIPGAALVVAGTTVVAARQAARSS